MLDCSLFKELPWDLRKEELLQTLDECLSCTVNAAPGFPLFSGLFPFFW